jgi:hypothetical protein
MCASVVVKGRSTIACVHFYFSPMRRPADLGISVSDSTPQALAAEYGQFDFCNIQPAAVFGCIVLLNTFGDPRRFGR